MSDLISRQAAIDGKISIQRSNGLEVYSDEAVPVEYLKSLPSAQPKRKTGKWIADNHDFWVCSNCKFPSEAHGANILYNFCPNCGADMGGEQDG